MFLSSSLKLTKGLIIGIYCLSSIHYVQASILVSAPESEFSEVSEVVKGAILVQKIDGEIRPICFVDTRGKGNLIPSFTKAARLESESFFDSKEIDPCQRSEKEQISEIAAMSSIPDKETQLALFGTLLTLGKSFGIGCVSAVFSTVAGASIFTMALLAYENEWRPKVLRNSAELGGILAGMTAGIFGTAIYGINLVKQQPGKLSGLGALICSNASLGVIYILKHTFPEE